MKSSSCMNRKFLKLIVYLTLVCFLGVGCGGFSDSGGGEDGSPEYGFIEGSAWYDGPSEGGQVDIYDQNGQSILATPTQTDQGGGFLAVVLGLPEEFYIEVSGGQVNKTDDDGNAYSEPFVDAVGRYVDHYQSGRYVEINILSSLVLDAWKELPENSYADLKQSVFEYLGFPDFYTMDEVLDMAGWNTALFDPEYFFEGMAESGYSDYASFADYVASLFNKYFEDPESLDGFDYPWRNMPEGMRDSALSGVYDAFGDENEENEFQAVTNAVAVAAVLQGIQEGVETAINIVGFVLNTVQQSMGDTEDARQLGMFLALLNEGGNESGLKAIMANLTAIQESIVKIDNDLNNFWAQMATELKSLQRIALSQKVNDATSKVRDWNDKLVSWKDDYQNNKSKPGESAVQLWTDQLNSVDTGVRQRVQDIYDGLFPANEKSVIQAWFEEMQNVSNPHTDPVKRASVNKKLYNAMRSNLMRLMMFQSMGLNLYAEMVNRKYSSDKTKAKELILDFTSDVLRWMKAEVQEFERVMELYALDQEWYIYSDIANLAARQRCPDFPGGLAKNGILTDVDRIVQVYVYADLKYDGTTKKIKSINQQGLVTIRVVAPAQNTEVADDFGIAGLTNQSAVFWDIYNDFKNNWRPAGRPSAPSAGPGSVDAAKEFSFSNVGMYGQFISGYFWRNLALDSGYPKALSGRSPFETRNTQMGGREAWVYRLFKYRHSFDPASVTMVSNRDYWVEMKATLGDASIWHPSLTHIVPIDQAASSEKYRWKKNESGAPCITFGAYGLKSSQKVRLMAFHGQSTNHSQWHDWWFRGWKNNNYDSERLFATRDSIFTFFDMQPLGRGWYAFKDAGTRRWGVWNLPPIIFFGQWSTQYTHNDGRNYVRVADNGEIKFDLAHIDYRCAFKLTAAPQAVTNEHVGARSANIHQPPAKMYIFKTNLPNIDTPGGNKYLKWRSIFGQWSRYYADGGPSDLSSRDTWVMIYPEYDNVANYFLTRPNNWNPDQ